MITVKLCIALEHVWQVVSAPYDVSSGLPDRAALLHKVDLSVPAAASEALLVNLITEAMECVGCFSPWYKAPAQAFGLVLVEDANTPGKKNWGLSTEARQRFQPLLCELVAALEYEVTAWVDVRYG